MNDVAMQGGLDLDGLDDSDFYHMRQLTTGCESGLFDVFHEPSTASSERFQQTVEYAPPPHLDYSPLSCKVEDSLVFDFPNPSSPPPPVSHQRHVHADVALGVVPPPTFRPELMPSLDPASASCRSADDNGSKPRRGRKRLPETVSQLYIRQWLKYKFDNLYSPIVGSSRRNKPLN